MTDLASLLNPAEMEDIIQEEDTELSEPVDNDVDDKTLQLLEKAAENPYDYDNHIAYITLLRQDGQMEELRQAREIFHSLFPFSEELWLQWLDDEEQSATSPEELQAILNLYGKAVADYLSIAIWSRYLDFVEKHGEILAEIAGVETGPFVDMCYRKALNATQYHIPESQTIWNRERDRRLAHLQRDRSQLSSVTKMYIERLKIPHAQMEETYSEFSAFVTQYSNDTYEATMMSAAKEYGKALKAFRERELYEFQLSKSNGSFEVYSAYLEWEQTAAKHQIPRLTQALFERALAIYWQISTIWEDYAYYGIQKKFEDVEITSILERAVRNCTWSGDLWGMWLRHLGQLENSNFDDLIKLKEKAISIPWLTSQKPQLVKFYFSWLSICQAEIITLDEESEEQEFLDEELNECLEQIGSAFDYPEGYLLGKLVARLKTAMNKEDEARNIWNAMAPANGLRADYWLERMTWESEQGHPELRQAMFEKNLFKVTDDPTRFCYAYISFLTEQGTLADLNKGFTIIRKVFKKHGKTEAPLAAEPTKMQIEEEPAVISTAPSSGDNKRKFTDDSEPSPAKKPRVDQENGLQRDREHATVIAKNFPHNTTDEQVRYFFRDCGTIRELTDTESHDDTRSVIIEFDKEADATTALTRNLKSFKGNEISVEKFLQPVLFVTNYPAAYDEAKLREVFSEFGTVTDVRLPSLAFNAKRRFAYIQFSSPSEAINALAADGREIDEEHSLVVKLSDPEKKKSRENPAVEGREIYIVNIDFDAKEADIRTLLAQYGEIQSLRLLTKPGERRHNGRGFVVYHSKEEADKALALDGTTFMSRVLKVQRSDPQRAGQSKQSRPVNTGLPNGRAPEQGTARQNIPKPAPGRAIGIIGIPDTVNEARLRSIIPEQFAVVKVEMKPDNEGAIVEFKEAADAGSAAMAIEGMQLSGDPLRIVTVRELKQHHRAPAEPAAAAAAPTLVPSSLKFGAKKKRSGKW